MKKKLFIEELEKRRSTSSVSVGCPDVKDGTIEVNGKHPAWRKPKDHDGIVSSNMVGEEGKTVIPEDRKARALYGILPVPPADPKTPVQRKPVPVVSPPVRPVPVCSPPTGKYGIPTPPTKPPVISKHISESGHDPIATKKDGEGWHGLKPVPTSKDGEGWHGLKPVPVASVKPTTNDGEGWGRTKPVPVVSIKPTTKDGEGWGRTKPVPVVSPPIKPVPVIAPPVKPPVSVPPVKVTPPVKTPVNEQLMKMIESLMKQLQELMKNFK